MEQIVNRVKTTALAKNMVNGFYDDLRKAPENGRKVIWTMGPVPFELLSLLNIAYAHGESYGAYAAARKGNLELKQAAEAEGYSTDACSYWRTLGGLAILEKKKSEIRNDMRLPLPDMVVAAAHCQTAGLWCESLARFLKVPEFVIDIPMTYDESEYWTNVEYVKSQVLNLISALEALTGKKLDYDKLKEKMALIKKAATLRRECMELCKAIPTPMSFFDCIISMGPIHTLRGTTASVDFYQALKNEIEERVANKVGVVAGEKYRLYWDNLPIWFKVGSLSTKLAEMHAVPIVGAYTHGGAYWEVDRIDPEKPLESIAEELLLICKDMNAKYRVERIAQMVREYSLDGLIMHSARTCRPLNIGQYDIINAIREREGIPGIVIEADPTDPNYYSESEIDRLLPAFVETMESSKQHRK